VEKLCTLISGCCSCIRSDCLINKFAVVKNRWQDFRIFKVHEKKWQKCFEFSFIHFDTHLSFVEDRGDKSPRRTRNTSRLSAISVSSAYTTSRWEQARSEMYSRHLFLDQPLSRSPVDVATRACHANVSWNILVSLSIQRSWGLSIRRMGGPSFRSSRTLPLRTLYFELKVFLFRCWHFPENPICVTTCKKKTFRYFANFKNINGFDLLHWLFLGLMVLIFNSDVSKWLKKWTP